MAPIQDNRFSSCSEYDYQIPSAIEFYCGLGGAAVALTQSGFGICLAADIDREAARVYQLNFPSHPMQVVELASYRVPIDDASLWWLSPPCLPFTRKGNQQDDRDVRTESLFHLVGEAKRLLPQSLVIENVPPFMKSQTALRIEQSLRESGYEVEWEMRCPTELGWPMRRRRCYLLASRHRLNPIAPIESKAVRCLASFLDDADDPTLVVDQATVERFRQAIDIVDASDPSAVVACFASAYGRSVVRCGSYLQCANGNVRRFSPTEMLRLFGFPEAFALPETLSTRRAYSLIGNSVSVPVVRWILTRFVEKPH